MVFEFALDLDFQLLDVEFGFINRTFFGDEVIFTGRGRIFVEVSVRTLIGRLISLKGKGIGESNVQVKLKNYQSTERVSEWSFKLENHFEKKLFKTLLKK